MMVGRLLPLMLLALSEGPAGAHGGLPLSMRIVWHERSPYAASQYWGIFVGPRDGAGGGWRWICDEAINGFGLRDLLRGGDGTLYATDSAGFSLSRDGGCTWQNPEGPLAALSLLSLVPDPVLPMRLWATSLENGQTVLWRSEDSGQSFERLHTLPGNGMSGMALSPDGKRLYLSGVVPGEQADAVLHVSEDEGRTFETRSITPRPADMLRAHPLASDARDGSVVYLLFQGDLVRVLMRADTRAGTFREIMRLANLPIYEVVSDPARDRLMVATGDGVYVAEGQGPLTRTANLSRAQCLSLRGEYIYACSWNYAPDMAAVARSDDGGASYSSIFQYHRTEGVLDCPAQTTVSRICPQAWKTYAPLLGIDTTPRMMEPPPMTSEGCRCTLSAAPQRGGASSILVLTALAYVLVRRRAARR